MGLFDWLFVPFKQASGKPKPRGVIRPVYRGYYKGDATANQSQNFPREWLDSTDTDRFKKAKKK